MVFHLDFKYIGEKNKTKPNRIGTNVFDRTRSGPYEMSRKGKHRVLPQNKELKRERERECKSVEYSSNRPSSPPMDLDEWCGFIGELTLNFKRPLPPYLSFKRGV